MSTNSTTAIGANGVGLDDRRRRRCSWDGPLLDDVSFEVKEGELTAITGFPPESKSALVRLLAGLRLPDRGAVYGTSGELGDTRASRLRTGEAAFVAGASQPGGWERLAVRSRRRERRDPSERLAAARQVTAIERVLEMGGPGLRTLFADLDPAGERESLEAIGHWVRSLRRTAIVAATDPRAAIAADRVLVLGGGRLIGDLERPERAELAGVMELAGASG